MSAVLFWFLLLSSIVSAQQLPPRPVERPQSEIQPNAKPPDNKTGNAPNPSVPPSTFGARRRAEPAPESEAKKSDQATGGLKEFLHDVKKQLEEFKPISDVLSTWALVGVGLWGVLTAIRTLRSIERQSNAIEGQTVTIIEGQRPKIAAKAHGNPLDTLEDSAAPRVELELINGGMVPAYDFTYGTWIEILRLPFNDFSSAADRYESETRMVLYPNHVPLIINIPIRAGITVAQLDALRARELHVCVRIRVRYRDAFSPDRDRSVDFGFVVYPSGLTYLPKYNDYR